HSFNRAYWACIRSDGSKKAARQKDCKSHRPSTSGRTTKMHSRVLKDAKKTSEKTWEKTSEKTLKKTTKRIALAVLLATAVATTAQAQKKYDPGATDTEIKIGNIMPYSGPASAYATIGKTEAAYFNKLNSEGGINGRKVNFVSYDDAYSPPKA